MIRPPTVTTRHFQWVPVGGHVIHSSEQALVRSSIRVRRLLVASPQHPGSAMPTIHLLDFLLVALVLAYGPVGAWRGGFREGVLGAGLVVTGALMISPPINWLKGVVQDRAVDGRLVIALLCLGVGLAFGVGAGRVVERHASCARGRLVGMFCGLANALWICTFLLVELEQPSDLSAIDEWLAGAPLFRPLVSHNEATLLALSTAGLFVSGLWTVSLIWMRLGTEPSHTSRWTPYRRASSRRRSIHVPIGADTGKLEPVGTGSSISVSGTVAVRRDVTPQRGQVHRRIGSRSLDSAERDGKASATQHRRPSVFWYSISPPDDSGTQREDDR